MNDAQNASEGPMPDAGCQLPEGSIPVNKPRGCLTRAFKLCLWILAACCVLIYFGFVLPFWGIPFNKSRHGNVPLTPPWALECWLWEDDVNTSSRVTELLDGYAKYDLPVRTILIDSPWSLRYNDFEVDQERYPEPGTFFRGLQDKGYRVVLWMTCMVNSRSKDTRITESRDFYENARAKGYLAGGGYQWRWWKGSGGFIDYTNPDAQKWWHGMQQQVLDWGVDGWKLDGCDTFFSGRFWKIPTLFNRTYSGWLTTRQYMDHYARDEYRNGLAHNPEFAILVRSMDHLWSHPEGFAPLDAAPVTWVGDNGHTWTSKDRGIESALTDILQSARLGYCVIGSDVAGYHGRSNPEDIGPATSALLASWSSPATPSQNGASPTPPPSQGGDFGTGADNEIAPNIYIRWAQFSTFCGLFLNGGHGERRLWKRSAPELEIIRKFSWLHTELVPYMYSHVVECHKGGKPLMRPLPEGDYHYLFGDDFLVAPIHSDSLDRQVSLPAGRWRNFFHDQQAFEGPAQLSLKVPMDEFPVFIREGAVIPMNVTRAYTGIGTTKSAGFRTWLIYPHGTNQFTLWHPETHPKPEGTTVEVAAGSSGGPLRITFKGRHAPHLLRIMAPSKPKTVTLDGTALQEGVGWDYDTPGQHLQIRTSQYESGYYEIFALGK